MRRLHDQSKQAARPLPEAAFNESARSARRGVRAQPELQGSAAEEENRYSPAAPAQSETSGSWTGGGDECTPHGGRRPGGGLSGKKETAPRGKRPGHGVTAERVRALHGEGLDHFETAARLGDIQPKAVKWHLKRLGLPLRRRAAPAWKPEEIAALAERLVAGDSFAQTAVALTARFGRPISTAAVAKQAMNHGLKSRWKPGDGARFRNVRARVKPVRREVAAREASATKQAAAHRAAQQAEVEKARAETFERRKRTVLAALEAMEAALEIPSCEKINRATAVPQSSVARILRAAAIDIRERARAVKQARLERAVKILNAEGGRLTLAALAERAALPIDGVKHLLRCWRGKTSPPVIEPESPPRRAGQWPEGARFEDDPRAARDFHTPRPPNGLPTRITGRAFSRSEIGGSLG